MALTSGYVWRGITITERPVFEPCLWASWAGLTLLAWGQISVDAGASESADRSAQLNLSYAVNWGGLRLEPGLGLFLNDSSPELPDSNTAEASATLSYRAAPLRVFWTQAFDVSNHKGATFGRAGFGVEDSLGGATAFSLTFYGGWASSRFNEVYIGLDRSAFNFVGAEGSVTWTLGSFYIEPRWSFSDIADREIREYLDQPTMTTVGIAIGLEF